MSAQKLTDKILLIDNDASSRETVKAFFEDNGFDIVTAVNGESGLKLFQESHPDLVLTDINMPVMNGLEVLSHLKTESPTTPVLVFSDASNVKNVIEALRLGAWDYIAKPIPNLAMLEHAVARALERARLVAENKRYREQLEIANQALKKSLDILEKDQEAGRSVQMRMLPAQNVSFGSYVFSHKIFPSLYLSGDFVDYFKINDHQMGFYIADISGHGSSSAFVTVLLKSLIDRALNRYEEKQDTLLLNPGNFMTLLGNEIHKANLGKYLTMVYGILDWEQNRLDYSIGGHYPNPILKIGTDVHFLQGKGFPVGIMQNAKYENITLAIPKKAELYLFSDGIAEILKPKHLPDKEKLLLSLTEKTEGNFEYYLKALALEGDILKSLPDDVTMLMIRRE